MVNTNIYAINNHRNERVVLISQLSSLFFRIQHTLKPLYAKFVAFRRKWRSISHIRYTNSFLPAFGNDEYISGGATI